MSLMLIRHTTPLVAQGICYGRTDLDVAESFPEEAQRVLTQLTRPELIISSPLRRCLKLAHAVGGKFEMDVQIDPRMQEMDFGRWEGMAWADINRDELDRWAADFMEARPHGGENVCQLYMRVQAGLAEYKARGKNTLIFTHAGVVKAAFAKGNEAADFETSIPFGGAVSIPPSFSFRSA